MRDLVLRTVLIVMIAILSNTGLAEDTNDVNVRLHNAMSQSRNKKPVDQITDAQLKAANPHQVMSLLALYEKDPEWSVRRMVYFYEDRMAEMHPLPEIRQKVTSRLVKTLAQTRSDLNWQAYNWLKSYTAKDFSVASKAVIHQAMAIDKPSRTLIRACGVANVQDTLPRLKELLIDETAYQIEADKTGERKWYLTFNWSARLARARLGIQKDIEKSIELVENEAGKNESHFVYYTT